jgi:hypothetical protein
VRSVGFKFSFPTGIIAGGLYSFSMDEEVPIIFSSIGVFDKFDYVCPILRGLIWYVKEDLGGVALLFAIPLCPFWIVWF